MPCRHAPPAPLQELTSLSIYLWLTGPVGSNPKPQWRDRPYRMCRAFLKRTVIVELRVNFPDRPLPRTNLTFDRRSVEDDPLRPPSVHRTSRDNVDLSRRRGAILIPRRPFSESHRRWIQPMAGASFEGRFPCYVRLPPRYAVLTSSLSHNASGLPWMTSRPVSST